MAAFDSKNYLKAAVLFREAAMVYRQKREAAKVEECQDFAKQCEEFLSQETS